MKIRHVFCAPDLGVAQAAVQAARDAGVEDHDVLLVARSDIELESILDERKEADTDMLPAALRGMGYGGATGLLAGLVAFAFPPLGVTLAGAAAAGVAGVAIGGWASALVGASVPDPVRHKFEAEIEAGNILVLIDGGKDVLDVAGLAIMQAGARLLPFESHKAMA